MKNREKKEVLFSNYSPAHTLLYSQRFAIERLHVTSQPVKHRVLPQVLTVNYKKNSTKLWQEDGRFYYNLTNAGVLKLELPVYHLILGLHMVQVLAQHDDINCFHMSRIDG